MPEMHLRKPGFTYSACGPSTINKERTKKIKNWIFTVYLSQRIS